MVRFNQAANTLDRAITGRRWLLLLLLGGLNLLVYWLGLLRPYSMSAIRLKPLVDVIKLIHDQPAAQARLALTLIALFGIYYLAWRVCRSSAGPHTRAPWLALLVSALAANLMLLWLYPVGAADIFDNIMRGRIIARYGGNPFYAPPSTYARDSFYPFVAWRHVTSAYGPLWELLSAGTARLAGDGVLANVLAYKALGLGFYAGCVALIAHILRRRAPSRALQGVCLFALNPLVIYETAGNGHNDVVMTFFILLGLAALLHQRFTWAALALTAGALIKFISILLLPVALVVGLSTQSIWRARLRFVLGTTVVCAAVVALLYAPFWQVGDPLDVERRSKLFTTSLPALVQAQLEAPLGAERSEKVVAGAAVLLMGVAVSVVTWRTWHALRGAGSAQPGNGFQDPAVWLVPVQAWTHILVFYLLFTCLWFQPWYVVWPLSLAAILPEGAAGRLVVLLSGLASWKTIIFNFLLPANGPLPPRTWRETILGPATLGIAWLYAGYAVLTAWWHHRRTRGAPSGA
jgi:hypothetical protein